MANTFVYSKGAPCTPPVVNGITFALVDEAYGLWRGSGPQATVDAMTGPGMPFMSEAELAQFDGDFQAVDLAESEYASAAIFAQSWGQTLGPKHKALVDAEIALAAAQAAGSGVAAAQAAYDAASDDYYTALASARSASRDEAAKKDALEATKAITERNGKRNPYIV